MNRGFGESGVLAFLRCLRCLVFVCVCLKTDDVVQRHGDELSQWGMVLAEQTPLGSVSVVEPSGSLRMGDLLTAEQEDAYRRAMVVLRDAGVPYLVAGAFALQHYTGIARRTKDIDLFLRPEDRDRALESLARAGFRTEVTAPHWLAKAFWGPHLIDLISGSGNWLVAIDDRWFRAADVSDVLGLQVSIISATDLIWAKAHVAGRERFDGADIAHIIRRASHRIDWNWLLEVFADHWELLLVHLHFYRFVYPMERHLVPAWVLDRLTERLSMDLRCPEVPDFPFRGPLLDRYSFLVDLEQWGEPDPREQAAQKRQIPPETVRIEREADRQRLDRTGVMSLLERAERGA